jgi:hypothetical protein
MFTPPSVNQIARAYTGNPQPLAAKVDKDKKQNGGIPSDLRQLLALNDLTQARQAMGNQQALQTPPAAQMPTVAQSVQQLAQQLMQRQPMPQAQAPQGQMPGGLQALMGGQSPQPAGIDNLRSNVGESYAEGGVVARTQHFQSKGAVQDAEVKKEEATSPAGNFFRSIIDAIGSVSQQNEEYRKLKAAREEAAPGLFEALTPTERAERKAKADEAARQLKEFNNPGSTRAPYPKAGPAIPGPYDRSGPEDTARETRKMVMQTPGLVDAVYAADPPKPAAQTRVNAPASPATGGAAAGKPAASILDELKNAGLLTLPNAVANTKVNEVMNMNPEVEKKKALADFEANVGKRDLSIFDTTAEELKARRERLNAPKPGFEGLMDYLEHIALAGGRTSAEAGARGSASQRAKQLERQGQQDTLMDKILELGAKKTEAEYGQKEKMYDLGQARYKEVFTNAFTAAKEVKKSDDEARRLGLDAVLRQKEMDNKLQAARIGASVNRDDLMSRARALMAVDKTLTLEQAMQKAATIAATGQLGAAELRADTALNARIAKIRENYSGMLKILPPDSPFAKQQKAMMEQEIAAARAEAGKESGQGSDSSSTGAKSTGQVKFLGYEK